VFRMGQLGHVPSKHRFTHLAILPFGLGQLELPTGWSFLVSLSTQMGIPQSHTDLDGNSAYHTMEFHQVVMSSNVASSLMGKSQPPW